MKKICFVVVPLLIALLAFTFWPKADPLGDSYIWNDLHAGKFKIQSLDKPASSVLNVDGVVAADVDGRSGSTCAVDYDRTLWLGTKPSSSFKRVGRVLDHFKPLVRADGRGNCFFSYDESHLGIASAGRDNVTSIAVSEPGFAWTSIDYLPATDTLAMVGGNRFAVVQNPAAATSITTVRINGRVMGLSVDDLNCCARLSPDGKTLYSVADAGDDDMSGHTVLAAFDSATGAFKRVYLPYFGPPRDCAKEETGDDARKLCEQDQVFPGRSFDKPKVAFAEGEDQSFDISPDGSTLYARAYTGIDQESDDAERSQVVAIDTQTGKVTQLPIASFGKLAVSASGKYLLVENATTVASVYMDGIANNGDLSAVKAAKKDPHIGLYSLPDGKLIRTLTGESLRGTLLGQY